MGLDRCFWKLAILKAARFKLKQIFQSQTVLLTTGTRPVALRRLNHQTQLYPSPPPRGGNKLVRATSEKKKKKGKEKENRITFSLPWPLSIW